MSERSLRAKKLRALLVHTHLRYQKYAYFKSLDLNLLTSCRQLLDDYHVGNASIILTHSIPGVALRALK